MTYYEITQAWGKASAQQKKTKGEGYNLGEMYVTLSYLFKNRRTSTIARDLRKAEESYFKILENE